jgi:hypothetical protein
LAGNSESGFAEAKRFAPSVELVDGDRSDGDHQNWRSAAAMKFVRWESRPVVALLAMLMTAARSPRRIDRGRVISRPCGLDRHGRHRRVAPDAVAGFWFRR